MLMALDEAQARLNEQQVNSALSVTVPQLTPVNQHTEPVSHSVNPALNDELERLRREVVQLKQDKSKEDEFHRMQHQLQNTRADLLTVRSQLNSTARKDQEMKREMELLKEQLAWKDQELREVRMNVLEHAPTGQDTRTEPSDNTHVVYQVNTESDESEPLSVNDQSTHVLNLRMKVGAGNTQANTSVMTGKHAPNNLQQLQIQGAASKNRSPSTNKSSKSSSTSTSTKKASVPSKGHKRSRDEMSRGHDETDEGEPVNKESAQLKMVRNKSTTRHYTNKGK